MMNEPMYDVMMMMSFIHSFLFRSRVYSWSVMASVIPSSQNFTVGNNALTITTGKVHEYLGMRIDYSQEGKVIFTMPHMTEEVLKQIPKELEKGPSVTPAANHLFMVNPDAERLSDQDRELFHRITAQLLYMSKRAGPDLQTAVSFLTTRVQAPDIDDFRKLGGPDDRRG